VCAAEIAINSRISIDEADESDTGNVAGTNRSTSRAFEKVPTFWDDARGDCACRLDFNVDHIVRIVGWIVERDDAEKRSL